MAEDQEMEFGELTESNTLVTPNTKRLALVCLTLIALAVVGAWCGEKIEIKDGLLIIIPIITSVSAMVDGGR